MITVRSDLRSLEGYHSPHVDVAVRLNTNESPFAAPEGFVERLERELAAIEWNRYPDRNARGLRAAIAEHHDVDSDRVFAANGSNEVLQTVLLAYAGPGREVLTFEPTYQLHAQIARITGSAVVEAERSADFSLDPGALEQAMARHRPDITFLCSPNNPTGLVDDPAVVQAAMRTGHGLIVADEAYAEFSEWSAVDLVDEHHNLVVVRTFSKTWSLAAARLGYLVGPTWLVAELDKVALPYHLDAVKQAIGRIALDFVADKNARVEVIVAERDRVRAGLEALDVEVVPSGANFILFRPRAADAGQVWQGLVDRGVLIRNCSSWPRLSGYLRVTIGRADENDSFLEALSEVLV